MVLGNLFIVTAASGAGKTSLIKELLAKDNQLRPSVSYTTRQPRPGEQDGVDYNFVSELKFSEMLNAGDFLESADVHGAKYGTSQSFVIDGLVNYDMILEIDWQGAEQIRKLYPLATSIFILPPSVEALAERLFGRGQVRSHCEAARSGTRGNESCGGV